MSEGTAARQPVASRFGFGRARQAAAAGPAPGQAPVAPPRTAPRREATVAGRVQQSTGDIREANKNIQGLNTLLKEQNSSSFKFGFRPGIFNNRNAASKNVQKVSKVIDNVDSLSLRANKLSSLVRRVDPPAVPERHTEYISSGGSNSSNISGSSISSDSDRHSARPAGPNLNSRVVDCNSNTPPGPIPPAKPLRSADLRASRALVPLASPRLRRVTASPLGSPKSPRSPRPRPRLLPKPSSGPSPYRSLATTTARPLVTSASGDSPTTPAVSTAASPALPSTTPSASRARTTPSQLPGLRASFFATEPQRLDSASLHIQGLGPPTSRLRAPERPSMVQRVRPSLDDSAPQASDSESPVSSLASISSLPSLPGRGEQGRTRAFVQHRQEARAPGQRKWVAKLGPAAPRPEKEDSVPSPRSDLDCLAKLKMSNRQAVEVGRGSGRSRLFAAKKVGLPAIPQEERAEEMEDMVVKEEIPAKNLSSPVETEDDSGIFTSAHSKYSLESLAEEGRPSPRQPPTTRPSVQLTRSLPADYGWSADVRSIRANPAVVMARSETRPSGLRGYAASRSVHNFTDSGEEFASRETSPMQLLDEICQREEEESEVKGRNRILPGLVSSRKQLLEAAIQQERDMRSGALQSAEERDSGDDIDKVVTEKPKLRSFVGLRNMSSTASRQTDFSAISGIDRLSLQLSGRRREPVSKEASPSLSEGSDASSDLASGSLLLECLPAPALPVMSTSTTSSSNLSQVPEGGKKTSSPDQADFLIDDDYNDQQELTFYGHDDSIEESLFEKMDSLLSRKQESQEKDADEDQVDGLENGVGEVVEVNVDFSPMHLPKIGELKKESEAVRQRRASVDTLASQASIAKDDEDVVEDCMLDFDFEERRASCKAEEGPGEEAWGGGPGEDAWGGGPGEEERTALSRCSSSASDEGVILDTASYEAVRGEVGEVRTMLLRLRRVLQEECADGPLPWADTVNPFDPALSLRPGNLYANLVLAESEQLVSAAEAIEKLSAAAAAGQDTCEDFSDPVKDISEGAVRRTVEENQDLRRQVVFLQQSVEERDRRIRALETLLVGERGQGGGGQGGCVNTASQTEKLRPKSVLSSSGRSTSSGEDPSALIRTDDS